MLSQNNKQQSTPSWRVNLTQKFNTFSKQKRQQKRTLIDFEKQLEQQLKIIPSKEELSSNRKQNLKGNLNFRLQNKIFKQNSNNKVKSIFDLSSLSESSPKKLIFNENQENYMKQNQQDSQNKDKKKLQKKVSSTQGYGIFNLFTNKKVAQLFEQYFQGSQIIQLTQLIDACSLQYLDDKKLIGQQKQMLIEKLKSIFCTTDQKYISLNAVQLITKKQELREIIRQILSEVRYDLKKDRLQKQYEKILVEIVEQQRLIQEQNEKVSKKKKQIQSREKELNKRQRIFKNQQKQLLEKQKLIRKTLQERGSKLALQMMGQVQKNLRELQKRSNIFERNARNKLELIQKRVSDYKELIKNIPEKDSQENINRKAHNEILQLRNKLKKIEREYEQVKSELSKQVKQMESQSISLLKANTILEGKVEKCKFKNKELTELLHKKEQELVLSKEKQEKLTQENQFLKQDLVENHKQIQILQRKIQNFSNLHSQKSYKQSFQILNANSNLNQLQLQKSSNPKTNSLDQQQKSQRSSTKFIKQKSHLLKQPQISKYNKHSIQANHSVSSQNKCIQNIVYPKQNIQIILIGMNQIFHQIMLGFQNHRNQFSLNNNTQNLVQNRNQQFNTFKIQEVLLDQSFSIFINCIKFFFLAIQNNYVQIEFLLQFMLNLFMAKLSFTKFKLISNPSIQSHNLSLNNNSVENFIQKIQIQSFRNQSVEEIYKLCSSYIEILRKQRHERMLLNFYIILSVIGLDQIYNINKNRSDLVIHLIKQQLIKNIQTAQQKGSKKIQLKQFQEEQFMTFFFCKYLSYSSRSQETFIFAEILIELCNFYSLQDQSIPLFKTIYQLQNYKYLFNYLLINLNEKNLLNDQTQKQILQNISIILQRFCYLYGDKITLEKSDISQLKKYFKWFSKNQNSHNSLLKANLESILSKLNQSENVD